MFATHILSVEELVIRIDLFPDTTTGVNPDIRPLDVATTIKYVDPIEYPLTALLKQLKRTEASDPKFEWFEHDTNARTDTTTTIGTGTTVAVSDGTVFTVNDIVKVPRTGEVMLVTAISSNNLTVTRGYGETLATALASGDALLIIGNAYAENTGAANENLKNETTVYNYAQTFKTAYSVSGRANATTFYTGKRRQMRRVEKMKEHLIDIERALLFGERGIHSTTTVTRGADTFISTNRYAAGGTLTQSEFDISFVQPVMQHKSNGGRYGNASKWLFACPTLLSVMNGWTYGQIQVPAGGTKFGFDFTTYVTPHGNINVVGHPLLTTDTYDGYGIMLDLGSVMYRYVRGRDTQLQKNIQNPDVDGTTDQFLTDCGLELANETQHGVITGVTG